MSSSRVSYHFCCWMLLVMFSLFWVGVLMRELWVIVVGWLAVVVWFLNVLSEIRRFEFWGEGR